MAESLIMLPRGAYPHAPFWDPLRFYYWPVFGRLYKQRNERCLEELPGGGKVLEVGFGSGVCFPNLSLKYKEIHGLDLDADVKALTQAFKKHGYRVRLRNGGAQKMPYPSNSFDAVMLVSILEHLKAPELAGAMKEIARVLKPGGRVVYGVPVERPIMVVLFRLMGVNIREHHFSTEKEVAAAARLRLTEQKIRPMRFLGLHIYETGVFIKASKPRRSR